MAPSSPKQRRASRLVSFKAAGAKEAESRHATAAGKRCVPLLETMLTRRNADLMVKLRSVVAENERLVAKLAKMWQAHPNPKGAQQLAIITRQFGGTAATHRPRRRAGSDAVPVKRPAGRIAPAFVHELILVAYS
jgi:hypothetical protein